MSDHEKLCLRDPAAMPTSKVLEQTLGESYAAYEAFQEALPGLEIEQEWQWYTPHKAWFAKGQHWWITKRGTRKEKNLYWLHMFLKVISMWRFGSKKKAARKLSAPG